MNRNNSAKNHAPRPRELKSHHSSISSSIPYISEKHGFTTDHLNEERRPSAPVLDDHHSDFDLCPDVNIAQMDQQTTLPTPKSADFHGDVESGLPPTTAHGVMPGLEINNDTSLPTIQAIDQTDDWVLPDMPDAFPDVDVLEEYWTQNNLLDPSLADLLDSDYLTDLPSSQPTLASEGTYVFKSPLTWVADWRVQNDRKYAEAVEQRAFNLPPATEINKLVKLYFTYAHHRLPVLHERHIYRLVDRVQDPDGNGHGTPISLALLYAMLFFACEVRVSVERHWI
jgi:hypothetical protein